MTAADEAKKSIDTDTTKPSEEKSTKSSSDGGGETQKKGAQKSSSSLVPVASVLVVLVGVAVALGVQFDAPQSFYYGYISDDVRVISPAELARHDSSVTRQAWLAILGEVFDVSRGASYKKGGSYDFFTGKDATSAFVTGEFMDDGLHADLTNVPTSSLLGVRDWNKFYHTDYKFLGRLHGTFYDEHGRPTAALRDYKERLLVAEANKKTDKQLRKKYPSCNQQSGSDVTPEVWCTERSGGVVRNWVGVPRKFYAPGSEKSRCVCVEEAVAEEMKGQMRVFEGCAPSSDRCQVLKTAKK